MPILKFIGASEHVIEVASKPAGHAAVVYLMYKMASPLRYAVTIGGTQMTVRMLRRLGYLPPISDDDRVRSLFREKFDELNHRRRSSTARRPASYSKTSRSSGSSSSRPGGVNQFKDRRTSK